MAANQGLGQRAVAGLGSEVQHSWDRVRKPSTAEVQFVGELRETKGKPVGDISRQLCLFSKFARGQCWMMSGDSLVVIFGRLI